ncbi:MAG: hypothetical protein KKE89_06700 [Actinobacteria bacterium]|nr:hypothetical protein [Actinomycetota bacterium]
MTTADGAAGRPPLDWKVTAGYRVLIKVGWAAIALALYGATVAVVVGIDSAWWITAGLSAFALLVGIFMPAPVPRELIIGGRNRIDCHRPLDG